MNRKFRCAFGLLATIFAGWMICSPAKANDRTGATVSARVHGKLSEFLQSRASTRVNHIEIPELDGFDFTGIAAADVKISLRTRLSGEFIGRVPVTVVVSLLGKELRRAVVTASLRSVVPVWVASRAMKRGEMVALKDFHKERRDISVLGGPVIDHTANLLGKRLRRSINAGRVWQPRYLESVPKVLRGERVRLRLKRGGLRIDGAGMASEDGQVGDWIRVRNKDSKRYVRGRVDPEGTVDVRF